MNTKIVMIATALFCGVLGILCLFLPQEMAAYFQLEINSASALLFKLLSALYLGFAILNWMGKANLIGGIYSRPVAIANFTHFLIGTISLSKLLSDVQIHFALVLSLTIIYAVFALIFGYIFFNNPKLVKEQN